MAITFGNTSNNAAQGTTSWSHNSNGDFLLVAVEGTTDTTGVSFNGVAMTQIGTDLSHTGFARVMNIWGLVNPASGSNTIALTGGANQNCTAVSISGTDQTSVAAAATGFNSAYLGSVTDVTISITTTVANAFPVAFWLSNTGSAGTDTTLVATSHVGYEGIIRSTNAVSPAGALSLHWTNGSAQLAGIMGCGINPPPAVNTTNFFAMM